MIVEYEFKGFGTLKVKAVFDYFHRELSPGFPSVHGGSSGGATIDGNTFLNLLGRSEKGTLNSLYHVNPCAGEFVSVTNEETTRVIVSPFNGRELDDSRVHELGNGLRKLAA